MGCGASSSSSTAECNNNNNNNNDNDNTIQQQQEGEEAHNVTISQNLNDKSHNYRHDDSSSANGPKTPPDTTTLVMAFDDASLESFQQQHAHDVEEKRDQELRDKIAMEEGRQREAVEIEQRQREQEEDYRRFEAERSQEQQQLLNDLQAGKIQQDLLVLDFDG
eukprot:PhM_4_TR18481/c0_g1_i1/m.65420